MHLKVTTAKTNTTIELLYFTYAPAAAEVNAPQGHEGEKQKSIVKINGTETCAKKNLIETKARKIIYLRRAGETRKTMITYYAKDARYYIYIYIQIYIYI